MVSVGKKLTRNNDIQKQIINQPIKTENIKFSFLYFQQKDYFGIGNCSVNWFLSLIERLRTLSGLSIENITNQNNKKSLRFHPIDWKQKNIPIQRKDLHLPSNILNNDEDFPIKQISLSTGFGRIVGFLYEDIFFVVLLDPNHNIQPSNKNNYQIQPTTIGVSEYDDLVSKLKQLRLDEKIEHILPQNIIYVDNDFYNQYIEIIKTHSLKEIIEAGILTFT